MSAVTSISGGIHRNTWRVQACRAVQRCHTKSHVSVQEKPQKILFKNQQKLLFIISKWCAIGHQTLQWHWMVHGLSRLQCLVEESKHRKQRRKRCSCRRILEHIKAAKPWCSRRNRWRWQHCGQSWYKKSIWQSKFLKKVNCTVRNELQYVRVQKKLGDTGDWSVQTAALCDSEDPKDSDMQCGWSMFQLAHTSPYSAHEMSAQGTELRWSLEAQPAKVYFFFPGGCCFKGRFVPFQMKYNATCSWISPRRTMNLKHLACFRHIWL